MIITTVSVPLMRKLGETQDHLGLVTWVLALPDSRQLSIRPRSADLNHIFVF